MSHYATVAINIYLASNLKMIYKKAHKVCKIFRLQFRLQYARYYGLYKNAMMLIYLPDILLELSQVCQRKFSKLMPCSNKYRSNPITRNARESRNPFE